MEIRRIVVRFVPLFVLISGAYILQTQTAKTSQPNAKSASDQFIQQNAQLMLDEGQRAFRFDTFGDEAFWGDTLKLHQAIAGAKNGGVGSGVSPKTALSVGLKVDADAIPAALAAKIKAGQVDLDDPVLCRPLAASGCRGPRWVNGNLQLGY